VKKLKYSPSPFPLPRGERGNTLKYKRNFPPPRWGRARVGVEMGFFHTFPPLEGEGEVGGVHSKNIKIETLKLRERGK
jgi:hypothetical protein